MKTYTLGALPSPQDVRDYSVGVKAATFPERVVLKEHKAYDQGAYGTCVMQVIRRCMEGRWGESMGYFVPYGRWRSHPLTGMYPNEAYNGLVAEGMAPAGKLKETPCDMPDAKLQADTLAAKFVERAAPFRGGSWHRLHTKEEVKACLMQIKALEERGIYGAGIGFCLAVGAWNPDRWGVLYGYTPDWAGPCEGYHWMMVAGYEPRDIDFEHVASRNQEVVKVLNSWGDGWGENGYCYMKWEDVLRQDDIIAYFPEYTEKEDDPVVKRRTLKKGMKGEDVAYMQEKLTEHGFGSWLTPYGADGDFGAKTESAVKAFQKSKKLDDDGICGPKTWAKLEAEPTEPDKDDGKEDGGEPSTVAEGLVAWCHSKIGYPYGWGGNGETDLSDAHIKGMDTSTSQAQRTIKYVEKQKSNGATHMELYDCSGLISRYLQNMGKVDAKRNCDHLWNMCRPLTRARLLPGDLLFRGSDNDKSHVGVYVGGGWVIEAQGRDIGIVKRPINASGSSYWKYYGRLEV